MSGYFKTTAAIEDAIAQRDEDKLKNILAGIIFRNPDNFSDAYKYITTSLGKDLIEDYKTLDGEYESSESEWDEDYLAMCTAWLSSNFCRERIEKVQKVAKLVSGIEKKNENFPKSGMPSKEREQHNSMYGVIIVLIFVLLLIFLLIQKYN